MDRVKEIPYGVSNFVEVVEQKMYYEYLLEEYQNREYINLNNLRDLYDKTAFDGHWREILQLISEAYQENSSVRSSIEVERNIQGFFTAYLSVNAYSLTAPEAELNRGCCDMFLMSDLQRYPEVTHSYILELKCRLSRILKQRRRTMERGDRTDMELCCWLSCAPIEARYATSLHCDAIQRMGTSTDGRG